jgi:predicted deacylase
MPSWKPIGATSLAGLSSTALHIPIPARRASSGARAPNAYIRAPLAGIFSEVVSLGDVVTKGDVVARVYPEDDSSPGDILAPFDGKVRGLLSSGQSVKKGFKVGDVDPRGEEVDETLISDKARAVAGGVLEAILLLRSRAAAQ